MFDFPCMLTMYLSAHSGNHVLFLALWFQLQLRTFLSPFSPIAIHLLSILEQWGNNYESIYFGLYIYFLIRLVVKQLSESCRHLVWKKWPEPPPIWARGQGCASVSTPFTLTWEQIAAKNQQQNIFPRLGLIYRSVKLQSSPQHQKGCVLGHVLLWELGLGL